MGIVSIIIFALYFIFPTQACARSGCCTWHGGVDYCDTNVGTYVCNDGSYSPSCGCAYVPQKLSGPTPVVFPEGATATWSWLPNSNKTFDLKVTLSTASTQYSAVLNKCRGCDPGPNTDFFTNNFVFNGIKPGTYYLNVKKEVNGYWSKPVYWTITVPTWYAPSPTPLPTIVFVQPTSVPYSDNSTGQILISFILFVIVVFGFTKLI